MFLTILMDCTPTGELSALHASGAARASTSSVSCRQERRNMTLQQLQGVPGEVESNVKIARSLEPSDAKRRVLANVLHILPDIPCLAGPGQLQFHRVWRLEVVWPE